MGGPEAADAAVPEVPGSDGGEQFPSDAAAPDAAESSDAGADAAADPDASTPPDGSQPDDAGPIVVLVGAGDITHCANPAGSEATAKLLDAIPGAVFTAGDNSNDSGTAAEYSDCFGPSWGRHLARMRTAMGNHDAKTNGGAPYYAYFGAAAGPAGKGYYSYELGAWHVIVLNSNCTAAGGCAKYSPQERWLAMDLQAHPSRCTLAIWHHPLFSSVYGGTAAVQDLWNALYAAGVDLAINGHDHVYERFAPQDPAAQPDPVHGIRQITVGTGGAGNDTFPSTTFLPNSEVHGTSALGVLKLTLRPDSYRWEFVPQAGKTFTDSGDEPCR
ncbi:MAG TPA: metallophosphoesterase [Myxococcales bacterium]